MNDRHQHLLHIATGEFQLVPGQKHDSGRSFTTAETIRAEKEVLRRMQQGQGRAEQIMSNRDLGTVQRIDKNGQLSVKMDNGKVVSFDANQMRHFDHGYAVTSQSSQGLTAERVIVNLDSQVHADLINKRFAYVAVSRGSHDAHIYTNDLATLAYRLTAHISKTSAVQISSENLPFSRANAHDGFGIGV